jgi:hypothetical protein
MNYDLNRFHGDLLRRGRSARSGLPTREESRRDLESARAPLYEAEIGGRLWS